MTDHLSIGEVLSLLQDEFPDVTISKIRFRESQGLIDPERTPSGYRKFYEADIDRLRWILVQQREHFLPLKVIKDRLTDPDAGHGELLLSDGTQPPVPTERTTPEAEVGADNGNVAPVLSEPPALTPAATPALVTSAVAGRHDGGAQPVWMADIAKASATTKANAAAEAAQLPLHSDAGATDVSLTAEELSLAAGLSQDALRSLEQYGLVSGKPLGDAVFYDGDALLVATKAAVFLSKGVEARHLRMYKIAAEREAGFLEQLAMPMLKQRNPQARRDAVDLVEELSALCHDLRTALLRANLRRHLDQA